MAQVGKRKLSASTDGRGILVAATASAGTLLHTAQAGTTAGMFDEVWLFAYCSSGTSRELVVQFGGTTSPNDDIVLTIPSRSGLVPVVAGLILQNGVAVRAYCASGANLVVMYGFVNQVLVA